MKPKSQYPRALTLLRKAGSRGRHGHYTVGRV